MAQPIIFSKEYLQKMHSAFLPVLERNADYFGYNSVDDFIGEIDKLGALVNEAIDKGGEVCIRGGDGNKKRIYKRLNETEDLLRLASNAYFTFKEGSTSRLYIFDGKKEIIWRPSRVVYVSDEEIAKIWEEYNWGNA